MQPSGTLILSPDNLWVDRGATASITAMAVDSAGQYEPVPNGTQARVDDASVVSADLVESIVHVAGLTAGHTDVWITKGGAMSNPSTVYVRATPVSIAMAIAFDPAIITIAL